MAANQQISLVILSQTSALLRYGAYRLLFGCPSGFLGDVDGIVIQRPSLEDLAGLPEILRRRNKTQNITVFTPSLKALRTFTFAEDICMALEQDDGGLLRAANIDIETYARIIETGSDKACAIFSGEGIYVESRVNNWTRANDARHMVIYTWPTQHPNAVDAHEALVKQQSEAIHRVREVQRTHQLRLKEYAQLQQHEPDRKVQVPRPFIQSFIWGPYLPAIPNEYQLFFTQRRMPYCANSPLVRESAERVVYTGDNIGREFYL